MHYSNNLLTDIEELELKYRNRYGQPPTNLSDWNPEDKLSVDLHNRLIRNSFSTNLVDYHFSYQQEEKVKKCVYSRLGFHDEKAVLFTPSGSTSIMITVQILKLLHIRKIYLFSPVYFTVISACNDSNIDCEFVYTNKENNLYDIAGIRLDKSVAMWITNPIYCTGIQHSQNTLDQISQFLDSGYYVVADECLAINGNEMARHFSSYKNFIGIYSPNKSLCINGFKFSAIISDYQFDEVLDELADPYFGCLSVSAINAIKFFLSEEYFLTAEHIRHIENTTWNELLKLIRQYSDIDTDSNSTGYLRCIYANKVPYAKSFDKNFLWSIIENAGAVFIPGARNHFSPETKFSFRINLLKDSPVFRGALVRAVSLLASYQF